jgi:ribosome maturation factor RimP
VIASAEPIGRDEIRLATTVGEECADRGTDMHAWSRQGAAEVPDKEQGDRKPAPAEALRSVVADAVGAAGFELETLDVQQAGRRRLVKVVVDGEDGVELDKVAQISRAVADVLDEHDHVLGGPYTLEVTSPGVDRPLTQPRHWRRARLRLVKVRKTDDTELTVRVGAADPEPDGSVQVLVDGALRELAYADVAKAVVEIEFKQPPAAETALLEQAEREGSR